MHAPLSPCLASGSAERFGVYCDLSDLCARRDGATFNVPVHPGVIALPLPAARWPRPPSLVSSTGESHSHAAELNC